jgi:pimeloyl-ACP methyl ester carboxylesterase
MPAPGDRTPVLLLHGFWHGSWCWTEVLAYLTGAGVRALAIDMAGHGLRAGHPAAGRQRPFDADALAADADAAFPANPTAVRTLEASRSPFLSMPDRVAGIVLDVLS